MRRGKPEPLGELSPSTPHTLWSLIKDSTEDSFLILNFSILRGKQKSFTRVLCSVCSSLSFPGEWPLKVNLENQMKQETREKARPPGTSLENGDRPPLPPLLHPFCPEEALIIFHSLCAQTSSFSDGFS